MHYWYFIETELVNYEALFVHKVAIPDVSEKGFYREVGSLNAFIEGTRRDATKEEKAKHRGGCSWSKTRLYYGHRESDMFVGLEREGDNFFTKFGERKQIPVTCHKSIYDFQAYIGFDRKKRKYVR